MRLWIQGTQNSLAHFTSAAINVTHHGKTIHLFRALLRQCTYLPDPAARGYMRDHVVSRFRDYHPRSILPSRIPRRRRTAVIEQRRPALLKAARRGVLYLQRANDGHSLHLGKILSMTYGRLGKRRHQLLQGLKVPDIPVDEAAIKTLSDPCSQGVPQPSQQLLALIKSQARRKHSHFSRSNTPTLAPRIPEKNSWGRPMPVKRVRNIKRRWYAQSLDRIMPPLSEVEWERLRKLAVGEILWEGHVPRRGDLGRDCYTKGIVRGQGFTSTPHELTPRYMRRLWAKMFAQCPLMWPNSIMKMGWEIKWGDVKSTKEISLRPNNQENSGDFAMFEGVDDSGKLLRLPPALPILVGDIDKIGNEPKPISA